MSDPVQRQPVNDPLAITGREQRTERSVQGGYVGRPNNGNLSEYLAEGDRLKQAFGGLNTAISEMLDQQKEDAITEGKVAFMSGVTEAEMLKNGDRFYQQGWKTLDAKDKANTWFSEEALAIDQSKKTMDPEGYKRYLTERRKQILDGIDDPDAKRVAAAAFEEFSPRLASEHMVKNSEYNLQQTQSKLSSALYSSSEVDANRSVMDDTVGMPLTAAPVESVIQSSPEERDIAIRTMLGEAAGEGTDGMAAVAHVLRNRAQDSRFPNTIRDVALQDKQFSTWNSGQGGNQETFRGIGPGNPLYDKAARVYDAVMSGRHVDPTHGATHYYAPGSVDAPDWAATEGAVNQVRIGGHLFVGRSDAKKGAVQGEVRFTGNADPGIQDSLKGVLSYAAGVTGKPITVTSGYRSPEHNSAVGGAKQSRHMHGDAADISMAGMSPEERQQLIRSLQAGGAKRFIAYTNSPDMLHVDLKDVPSGQSAFMFDKSQNNMENAPDWFKAVAASPAAPAKGRGTSTQNFLETLNSTTIPDDMKASALADAMRRQFDDGTNQLFNDAGGLGMLYKLGAKPQEIDEVLRAQERYKAKQLNSFNIEQVKFEQSVIDRASKGESLDTILGDIKKRVDEKSMDDNDARALASQAAERVRARQNKEGADSKLGDPNLLQELGGLYQVLKHDPNADFKTMTEKAQAIAKRYGASENDIKAIGAEMFNIDQQRKDSLIRNTEQAAAQAAKVKAVNDRIDQTIAQGWGGSNLTGEINGVPAKNIFVDKVRSKYASVYTEQVNAGKITDAEAKARMVRDTYRELRQHNVIDEQFRAHTTGALLGNIVGKDGKITEGALQAYDAWRTLRQTDPQMAAYLGQTIDNEYVRTLLETANTLDDGNLNQEQALLKAHEIMNDTNRDPNDRLKQDDAFNATAWQYVNEVLKDKSNPGFWLTALGVADTSMQEQAMSLENTTRATDFIIKRAQSYHLQSPFELPKASLEKAKQDLANSSHLVAGNLLIGESGKPLRDYVFHGQNGLSDTHAKEAIEMFISEHGKDLWKQNWTDRQQSYAGAAFEAGPGRPAVPRQPKVNMHIDPVSNTVIVDLYKDDKNRDTVQDMKVLDLGAIGDYYVSKRKPNEPTTTDKMWNDIFGGLGRGARDLNDYAKTQAEDYQSPGAAIGGMIKMENNK